MFVVDFTADFCGGLKVRDFDGNMHNTVVRVAVGKEVGAGIAYEAAVGHHDVRVVVMLVSEWLAG